MMSLTGHEPGPFDGYSDDDLRVELNRREEVRKEEERRARDATNQLLVDNVDFLLALNPKHINSSCSDKNVRNAFRAKCYRCVLLEVKSDKFWPHDVELEISLMYQPEGFE